MGYFDADHALLCVIMYDLRDEGQMSKLACSSLSSPICYSY